MVLHSFHWFLAETRAETETETEQETETGGTFQNPWLNASLFAMPTVFLVLVLYYWDKF